MSERRDQIYEEVKSSNHWLEVAVLDTTRRCEWFFRLYEVQSTSDGSLRKGSFISAYYPTTFNLLEKQNFENIATWLRNNRAHELNESMLRACNRVMHKMYYKGWLRR